MRWLHSELMAGKLFTSHRNELEMKRAREKVDVLESNYLGALKSHNQQDRIHRGRNHTNTRTQIDNIRV